jgi:hypothetical protein
MSGIKCFLEMNQCSPTLGKVLQAIPAEVPAVKNPVVKTKGRMRAARPNNLSLILLSGPKLFMVVTAS